jgi:hypothetical protein
VVCVGVACADGSGMGVSSVSVILCCCWVARSAVTGRDDGVVQQQTRNWGSDVAPGLTFNMRQGRQNCVDLPELAQPHTNFDGDDVVCRHRQTTLHHHCPVAETSAASFTADVELAGHLCCVRACCRSGGSLMSAGSGGQCDW